MSKKYLKKIHIDFWKYGGELEPQTFLIPFSSFYFKLNFTLFDSFSYSFVLTWNHNF